MYVISMYIIAKESLFPLFYIFFYFFYLFFKKKNLILKKKKNPPVPDLFIFQFLTA